MKTNPSCSNTHLRRFQWTGLSLLIAGTSEPVFAHDAVLAIHSASRGIPRVINLICEHSLISGYVEQIAQIPERTILSVATELDLETQPFSVAPNQGGLLTIGNESGRWER